MATRTLVTVSAGLGQPSSTRLLADRLTQATQQALETLGIEPLVEIIELREHAQDLTNNLLTGFPNPGLRAAVDAVLTADGLIAVSPVFNASYSGLFKLFFDVLERDGLAGKPVLIAATGGTARHSLALDYAIRPLFAYLNAATVATAVFAASEDWGIGDTPAEDGLADRIGRAATELAEAMARHAQVEKVDPYAAPVPFERLLRGER